MVVRKVGPVFTLVSKGISRGNTPNSFGSTISTSTLTATFSLTVQAIGGEITFGSQASTSPMFSLTNGFKIYNSAGTDVTSTAGAGATTTGFAIPSSGVVTSGLTNSFKLQENNTVTISGITVTIPGKTSNGLAAQEALAVGINAVTWYNGSSYQTSSFMSGKTEWRTGIETP